MNKREINRIASRIKKANLAIWAAIHYAEEIHALVFNVDDEEIKAIALRLKDINEEDLAEPDTNSYFFQEYQSLMDRIEKYQSV